MALNTESSYDVVTSTSLGLCCLTVEVNLLPGGRSTTTSSQESA